MSLSEAARKAVKEAGEEEKLEGAMKQLEMRRIQEKYQRLLKKERNAEMLSEQNELELDNLRRVIMRLDEGKNALHETI